MKTAILITARLKSVRLPQKVKLMIHDKPMLAHMLDRLKLAERPQQIVVITSWVDQDDPLEELAHQQGAECFRGHPDDVLVRMRDAALHFGVNLVVSCTADNPFVDPVYIDQLVDHHIAHGNDFTKSEGLPWGVFAYAINTAAIVKACELKDQMDTEVWMGYFMETGRFRWGVLPVTESAVRWPELRLTVDVPEDFELVNHIFDELYTPGQVIPLAEIVSLCRRKPELAAINANILQKVPIAIKTRALQ